MKRKLMIWFFVVLISSTGGIVLGKIVNKKEMVLGVASLPENIPYYPPPPDTRTRFEDLTTVLDQSKGLYSLYVKDLSNSAIYTYDPTYEIYGASLYKLLVASAVLHLVDTGDLDLSYIYSYRAQNLSWGTGSLNTYPTDTRFTVEFLLELLLKESDNTAQDILLEIIGKDAPTQAFVDIMGDSSNFPVYNLTNAKEVGLFLEKLYVGSYLSKDAKDRLFDLMSHTQFDDRISSGLDSTLTFSHKIGNWGDTGSWHDCGLVSGSQKEVVVCLMSQETDFESFLGVSKRVGQFVSLLFK